MADESQGNKQENNYPLTDESKDTNIPGCVGGVQVQGFMKNLFFPIRSHLQITGLLLNPGVFADIT